MVRSVPCALQFIAIKTNRLFSSLSRPRIMLPQKPPPFGFQQLELEHPERLEEADKFLKKFDYFYFPSLVVWSHWDCKRTVKLHQPFDLAHTIDASAEVLDEVPVEKLLSDKSVDYIDTEERERERERLRRLALEAEKNANDKSVRFEVKTVAKKKSMRDVPGTKSGAALGGFGRVLKYSYQAEKQAAEDAAREKREKEKKMSMRRSGSSFLSSSSGVGLGVTGGDVGSSLPCLPPVDGAEKKSSSDNKDHDKDKEKEEPEKKEKKPKLPPLQLGPDNRHLPMIGNSAQGCGSAPLPVSKFGNVGETLSKILEAREMQENYYDCHMKYLYLIKRTPITRKMKNQLLKKPDRIQRAIEIFDEFAKLKQISRQHPNLTRFVNCYRSTNELIMISEFQPARDLKTYIRLHKRGVKDLKIPRLPWEDVKTWTAQVTHALAYLHSHKLVHRNVKPSNVFLEPLGDVLRGGPHYAAAAFYRLKVGDFGSSLFRCYGDQVSPDDILTWPPEVVLGEKLSEKTDMWGIGLILWELCCLKPPFRFPNGSATTTDKKIDYIEKVVTFGSDVPDVSRFGEEKFPKRYVKAFPLLRMLFAKEKSARPSCGDLLAAPDSALRFEANSVEDFMMWRREHPTLLVPDPEREVRFLPDGDPALKYYEDEPLPPQPWHVLPPTLCEALSIASFKMRKQKLLRKARFFAKTKLMLRQNFGQSSGITADDDDDDEGQGSRKSSKLGGNITESPQQEVTVVLKDATEEHMPKSGGDRFFAKVEKLKAKAAVGRVGLKGISKKKNAGLFGARKAVDHVFSKNKPTLSTFTEMYAKDISPENSPRRGVPITTGGNFGESSAAGGTNTAAGAERGTGGLAGTSSAKSGSAGAAAGTLDPAGGAMADAIGQRPPPEGVPVDSLDLPVETAPQPEETQA
eukprot:g7049.t1